mgnify:CR=1 FL=1
MNSTRNPPRVTVLGAGFAGLSTIRELRRRDAKARITLVAPRAELHYLPGIIWIPSGLRTRQDLVVPLDNFLRRMQVDFHAAEVTGLADGGRTVLTTLGEVANDALVIATGGRFIKKLPGIEHAITPCEGIAAAERIRDRLKAMQGGRIAVGFAGNPNEPTAVRGGPMFEFLFGIDEQLRREGRRERFEIVFFNPSNEPGNRLGPKAVKHLLDEMARRGIRTHLGHKLQRFEAGQVVTEGGSFAADLVLFMVDARDGVLPADQETADIIRRARKPMMLVVNKVDTLKQEAEVPQFYELAMGDPIPISAYHNKGIEELMQKVVEKLDSPFSKEIHRSLQEMRVGKLRADALKDMAKRIRGWPRRRTRRTLVMPATAPRLTIMDAQGIFSSLRTRATGSGTPSFW